MFAGVLVINVTWRGKTYVGTLLDSTRHANQWAPPRYDAALTDKGEKEINEERKAADRSEIGSSMNDVSSEI